MFSVSNPIRKDMDKVSFVGLHNTKEGIIAFADSKATRKLDNGSVIEDINRGRIRKVFKNEHFICVTHGNNELFNEINKMNIEDYFKNYLNNEKYEDFFEELYKGLLENPPEYNSGIYHFIIGSKNSKGLYIRKLYMNIPEKKMEYSEKDYAKRMYYAGEEKYVQVYNLLIKPYDTPIEKSINKIKNQVETMVDLFDNEPVYNSVEKPIIIETFS